MLGKVLTGTLIVVTMRWTDRLIGLISTLILARLLLPNDFGVVAMASLIVGLLDVLLDLGVVAVLIHKKDCDTEDYNNAWTVRLIQSTGIAILIALIAPLAANYYSDERVTDVLRVMALTTLVAGFENIGIVAFQKDMRFGRDFQFFFMRRVIGFSVTMGLAWWLESYWALPIGALAGRIAGVALSYGMHPFRPRWSLNRFSSIWSFSQWMLLRSIGMYVDSRLDKLLIGHRADASVIGAYSLADEIAAMPTTELLAPIGRVLFPAFVEAREQPERLKQSYLMALAVQTMLAVPAGTGLALVARNAVELLLGERWLIAVPFVQILALIYGINAISHAAGYLLLTLGRVRIMAQFIWLQVAIFACGALTFFGNADAETLAQWRLVVAVIGASGFIAMVLREVRSLSARDILIYIWRPFASASLMAVALMNLPVGGFSLMSGFLLQCATGAIIYCAAILSLWILAGKPSGGEAYIIGKIAILTRRQ